MDKRATHEKPLLKRLVISFYDLTEARQFLNRLLGLNGETPPPVEDWLTRAALQTALVVGYARPFSNNEQAPSRR